MTPASDYQPATWLRELMRTHPARLPVGLSIRAAICVSAPLLIGLVTDRFDAALWVTLATLTMAGGEGSGTYRSRLRQIAIATPFAVLGFLASYVTLLPYPAVIAAMALLAFLSGIVSSFGAPYSNGAMQALLFACVMIGLPQAGPPWQIALLYLLAVAFYVAVLGAEALLDRHRPERQMRRQLFEAMASLAEACAAAPDMDDETPAVESARRVMTDASMRLLATVMDARRNGRTRETDRVAATLDASDIVFSGILAARQPDVLRETATWLRAVAAAVARNAGIPAVPSAIPAEDPLRRRLGDLAAALEWRERGPATSPHRTDVSLRPSALVSVLTRFIVGREVLRDATALGLCIGLAFAARYVVAGDHWYWIPLTVAIVMKPDLGSIFARAVQRSIGTCLGVVVGAMLLVILPKGPVLIAAITLLAALLPWARLVSYAVQALVLTPLVLILLDLIANNPGIADYGAQRLDDTVIGAAIVLVFGYFLWPQHQRDRLASDFDTALQRMAYYLGAVCDPPREDDSGNDPAGRAAQRSRVVEARRGAYGALSNLRASLQRSLAEPPPAGREAAAWFPIVTGAERICDRITARAAQSAPETPPPPAEVREVADRIRGIAAAVGRGGQPQAAARPTTDPFLGAIAADAAQLAARLERDLPATGPRHAPFLGLRHALTRAPSQ